MIMKIIESLWLVMRRAEWHSYTLSNVASNCARHDAYSKINRLWKRINTGAENLTLVKGFVSRKTLLDRASYPVLSIEAGRIKYDKRSLSIVCHFY